MTNITIVTAKAKAPGNLADEYLHLKAQMSDLKKQEKALQNVILATGKDVIEGNFGRVVVSEIKDHDTVDYKWACEDLLKPELVAKYTKLVRGGFRFNVRARIGNDQKAA